METTFIDYAVESGVATITLKRPEIAKAHPFALRQAKRAVSQTLDAQGFYAAIQSEFDVHQAGHGHALSESGLPILMLLDSMKEQINKPTPSANGS